MFSAGACVRYTALTIAEIIQDTDRNPILLRGGNYIDPGVTTNDYHWRIQTALQQQLGKCNGRNVVIFDEVQKVAPQVLDVFSPVLEHGEFEFLSKDGKVRNVHQSRASTLLSRMRCCHAA